MSTIVGPISCTGHLAQMSADSVFFVSEDGRDGQHRRVQPLLEVGRAADQAIPARTHFPPGPVPPLPRRDLCHTLPGSATGCALERCVRVLDRLNAAGIPATPLHVVKPVVAGPCLIRLEGWSEAGTGPRSLVLATGDAQAGTRSRVTGASCCRIGVRLAAGRPPTAGGSSERVDPAVETTLRWRGCPDRGTCWSAARFLHTKPSGLRRGHGRRANPVPGSSNRRCRGTDAVDLGNACEAVEIR